jgi:hypothetical protein
MCELGWISYFYYFLKYYIFESNEVKYIILGLKVLHSIMHLHYQDEKNAYEN